MFKKTFALILTLAMLACLFIAPCYADGQSKVIVGIADNLEDLAPWGDVTKPSRYIVYGNIYQHLMQAEIMGSDELQPVLAKEWTQDDEFTYTITLFDYIKDTDGNEFKASDAIFSLKSWAETADNYIGNLEQIDDYTFKITLTSSAPGTFQRTMESAWMVTEAAYNASADGMATQPVGTNPYKVTEFTSDSKIVVEKVADHWQSEDLIMPSYKANVDVIEYDIITEATQMAMALQSGTIQLGCELDISLLDNLLAQPNLALTTGMCPSSRGIMFNMTEGSPFHDNLALREAVCYAIDEESLADFVTQGYGWVAKTSNNYESEVGYNTAWESDDVWSYNPDLAKEKLAEAGYKDGELSLVIMSNGNTNNKNMVEIIVTNLQEIGINAEMFVADSSTFGAYRDATSGVYDISFVGQDYGNNVLTIWNNLYDSDLRSSGLTWGGYDDANLQAMLDELNTQEGFTQENVDAFYYYTKDLILYYTPFMVPEVYVHANTISDLPVDCYGYARINAANFAA